MAHRKKGLSYLTDCVQKKNSIKKEMIHPFFRLFTPELNTHVEK